MDSWLAYLFAVLAVVVVLCVVVQMYMATLRQISQMRREFTNELVASQAQNARMIADQIAHSHDVAARSISSTISQKFESAKSVVAGAIGGVASKVGVNVYAVYGTIVLAIGTAVYGMYQYYLASRALAVACPGELEPESSTDRRVVQAYKKYVAVRDAVIRQCANAVLCIERYFEADFLSTIIRNVAADQRNANMIDLVVRDMLTLKDSTFGVFAAMATPSYVGLMDGGAADVAAVDDVQANLRRLAGMDQPANPAHEAIRAEWRRNEAAVRDGVPQGNPGLGYNNNVVCRARDRLHAMYRSVAAKCGERVVTWFECEKTCYFVDLLLFVLVAVGARYAWRKFTRNTVDDFKAWFVAKLHDMRAACDTCGGQSYQTGAWCSYHKDLHNQVNEWYFNAIEEYGSGSAFLNDDDQELYDMMQNPHLVPEGSDSDVFAYLARLAPEGNKQKKKAKEAKRQAKQNEQRDSKRRNKRAGREEYSGTSGNTMKIGTTVDDYANYSDESDNEHDYQDQYEREYSYADLHGESKVKGAVAHVVPLLFQTEAMIGSDGQRTNAFHRGGVMFMSRHGVSGSDDVSVSCAGVKEPVKTDKMYQFVNMPDIAVLKYQRPAKFLKRKNTQNIRAPRTGEKAMLHYLIEGVAKVSMGVVRGEHRLGVGKVLARDFEGTTEEGCCGGIIIAQSDGAVIGFMGIGDVTGTVLPKFYPVTNGFIDEVKKVESMRADGFEYNAETDRTYALDYKNSLKPAGKVEAVTVPPRPLN